MITCRSCKETANHALIDLGKTPISNAFRTADQEDTEEATYPLIAYVCTHCWLVQLKDFHVASEMFHQDYAYFSSFSSAWLAHVEAYAEAMVERFNLGTSSQVVEIASNDGYLLQYFKAKGIPVLGVDPSRNVAAAAEKERGVETLVEFFGRESASRLAATGRRADLMAANNVLAHVPDINDFMAGFKTVLKEQGVATFEFPHLLNLVQGNQFDTIYHEHYSYLSLLAVENLLARHGLRAFDVEELWTHGGSLRVFVTHQNAAHKETRGIEGVRSKEREAGVDSLEFYQNFRDRVRSIKYGLLKLLLEAKMSGKTIVAYGAAAKGNTMLNYCGVDFDFIDFAVDRNPHKQGMFLPGTGIPVRAPEDLAAAKPDYVLILPWNLKEEIIEQLSTVRDWGAKFIVPVPSVTVIE